MSRQHNFDKAGDVFRRGGWPAPFIADLLVDRVEPPLAIGGVDAREKQPAGCFAVRRHADQVERSSRSPSSRQSGVSSVISRTS
jgi:hypothetical protein